MHYLEKVLIPTPVRSANLLLLMAADKSVTTQSVTKQTSWLNKKRQPTLITTEVDFMGATPISRGCHTHVYGCHIYVLSVSHPC